MISIEEHIRFQTGQLQQFLRMAGGPKSLGLDTGTTDALSDVCDGTQSMMSVPLDERRQIAVAIDKYGRSAQSQGEWERGGEFAGLGWWVQDPMIDPYDLPPLSQHPELTEDWDSDDSELLVGV